MTQQLAQDLAPHLAEFQARRAAATVNDATGTDGKPFQPTKLEKQLFAEARKAITAWQNTPQNQQKLAAIAGLSQDQLRNFLHGVLLAPEFEQMNALVAKHRAAAANDISFPLEAVSVGIEGSLVLIVGVQGSIGVAVDASDPTNLSQDVVYASGQIEIGVGIGGEVGMVVGFWNVLPINLGGVSYGWEVEVDDIIGGYVEASYSNINMTGFLGVSVSADSGEEDGAEGEASYTMVWAASPIYQPPAKNYMIIDRITCNENSEAGHDEVYFYFTIDNGTRYRYPTQGQFSMEKGDGWNAGRSIKFNNQVYVQLFDHDDPGDDDSLGSYTFTTTNFPTSVQVSGSGGKYTLSSVLNPVWRAYS